MRKFKLTSWQALTFILSLGLFISCQEQAPETVPEEPQEISSETKAKFEELGFDVSDIRMTDGMDMLDPASEGGNYLLEDDIIITPENLEAMLKSSIKHTGAVGEQYRTNNLVSSPRTISVIGYTANNSNGLDNTMQTALQWAINNYNALNTGLTFTLSYGTNWPAFDMVVYRVGGSGGGSAGFPSGGDPYQFIRIQSGTSNFGTNTTEHVITHEIGHAVGLRHTDYFNRSLSCGTGGNEGSGGVGAVYIPGTPSGFDANSVMLSCFSANEDGEFGNFDVVALEFLY